MTVGEDFLNLRPCQRRKLRYDFLDRGHGAHSGKHVVENGIAFRPGQIARFNCILPFGVELRDSACRIGRSRHDAVVIARLRELIQIRLNGSDKGGFLFLNRRRRRRGRPAFRIRAKVRDCTRLAVNISFFATMILYLNPFPVLFPRMVSGLGRGLFPA